MQQLPWPRDLGLRGVDQICQRCHALPSGGRKKGGAPMHQGQVLHGFSYPVWQGGAHLGLYLVTSLPQLLHCSARRSVELCTVLQVRSDAAVAGMSLGRGGGTSLTLEVLVRCCHTALDSFLGQAIDLQALLFPCDGCVALLAVKRRSTWSNPVPRIDPFAKPPDDKGASAAKTVQTSESLNNAYLSARTPAACSSWRLRHCWWKSRIPFGRGQCLDAKAETRKIREELLRPRQHEISSLTAVRQYPRAGEN